LLSVIELLFLSLTVEALQGKMCQDSLLSGEVGQFQPRFQGEGVIPWEFFFGFYKTADVRCSDIQAKKFRCPIPMLFGHTLAASLATVDNS